MSHSRHLSLTLVFILGLGLLAVSFLPPAGRQSATDAGDDEARLLAAVQSEHPSLFFQAISINRADAPQLTVVPGIGPELARRIVAYRASNGPFRDLADLERVRGIGPAKLADLRAYCSL
ncbi:MAG: hypothetical protein C0613_04825 [Desulfobulbaceae bacterium]|nr:MAG: hypothetical protein C0613_04825 [Desulfobulbaceae bacterium]